VTVVASVEKEASRTANRAKWTRALVVDVANERETVRRLVGEADVVISLLPAGMHAAVAKDCVDLGKDLVTTSYIAPEMTALSDRAKEAGVTLLNEVGLDPGMDHLSAMRIIDDARARGGMVTKFSSICGGLPAPEAANNPFLYKFSWSPRAVLSAAGNSAVYLEEGRQVTVDGEALLTKAMARRLDAWPTLRLEVLPNRDSLKYGRLYGIEGAGTVFRGTLRYEGWSTVMYGCKALGLMSPTAVAKGASWREELCGLLGVESAGLEDAVVSGCEGGGGGGGKIIRLSSREPPLMSRSVSFSAPYLFDDPVGLRSLM
jgi:alpha-aminoadipic semialdehyde synthase